MREKSLEWGDNWKDKIVSGVDASKFAVIVISKNYFDREWTEKDLNDFLHKQNSIGQKIVLPLLYNISLDDLKLHYPELSEIQCLSAEHYDTNEIALLFAKQLIMRIKNYSS